MTGNACYFLHVTHLYTFPVCSFHNSLCNPSFKIEYQIVRTNRIKKRSYLYAQITELLQMQLMHGLRGLAEILCRIIIPCDLPSSVIYCGICCSRNSPFFCFYFPETCAF